LTTIRIEALKHLKKKRPEEIMNTCYLCKNDTFDLVTEKLRYNVPKKAYKCKKCGLVFLSPRMTPEEERIFYEKEYGDIYSTEKGTTPDKLFQSRLPDANRYFDWVKPYLDHSHKCLELGCASGYFLATIRDTVAHVSGIETHKLLSAYCRNIGINTYESLEKCGDAQFDRVFMFFLLEHIGDPVQYLHSVDRVMKPGGKLFIVVPNVNDALMSLYDIPAFKDFYFTPAHQYYYTKETLTAMLKKAGMSTVSIFPRQRYDLSNHMHWMMNGKPGGAGCYNSVFSEKLLHEYAKNLEDHFLCDTLFAVITKTER